MPPSKPLRDPITTGVFEMFKVGLGPSSSHSSGPMIAASHFRTKLNALSCVGEVRTIHVILHGSLAATGKGHGTDRAIAAGLLGFTPTMVTPDDMERVKQMMDGLLLTSDRDGKSIAWEWKVEWNAGATQLVHPNTMVLIALNDRGPVFKTVYLSIGGGFVEELQPDGTRVLLSQSTRKPEQAVYHFRNAADIVTLCGKHHISWSELMLQNECAISGWSREQVIAELSRIWKIMRESIDAGIRAEGDLPGPLKVQRRARETYRHATSDAKDQPLVRDPLELLAHAYALSVNEENASGHRVVTAPTNGAAGVVPGVFAALQDARKISEEKILRGMLTAALIGSVIKANASISGAEIGCQGEVGAASAMAAGGLVEMMTGTPHQVEMAAEICVEHHLGMTCDPIGGLVQIPCIERNVMGAVKAIHAATMALQSSGVHKISLDQSIEAMRQIGKDMRQKYKETSQGGLAKVSRSVSETEC